MFATLLSMSDREVPSPRAIGEHKLDTYLPLGQILEGQTPRPRICQEYRGMDGLETLEAFALAVTATSMSLPPMTS